MRKSRKRSRISRKRISKKRRISRKRISRKRISRSPRVIWNKTTHITKPKYFSEPTSPPESRRPGLQEGSIQTDNCEGYWGDPLSDQEKKNI